LEFLYNPLFKDCKIFAELTDSKGFFKVLVIDLIYPKKTQKSIGIEGLDIGSIEFPIKILMVSNNEVFFDLKVFGI
jgi:hypothetical protein